LDALKKSGAKIVNADPPGRRGAEALRSHHRRLGQEGERKGVDGAKILAEFRAS